MLKELFNLSEEENLILYDNIENIIIKNQKAKLINGTLIQADEKCPKCRKKKIVKNGTYKSDILFNKINNQKLVLRLKKQRYLCNNCELKFVPKTKLIDENKSISNQITSQVIVSMTGVTSHKQIARENFISPSTVQRNLARFKHLKIINKKVLPKVLCVDEFRGVKSYNNKMNFIIVDGNKHKIKDILLTRRKNSLEKYFRSFTLEAKSNVNFFVTDFWGTYIGLAKKQFPNAKIIIDRFHIKRLMRDALLKKRIEVMNRYRKYYDPYKVTKKFRDLLYKKFKDIDCGYRYYRYYENFKNEYEILDYIIGLDDMLRDMYWLYQDFISAFDNKNIEEFKEIIRRDNGNISNEMKSALSTYLKYEEYVINALKYPYSNGVVEGINNKIKLIKRIGYGFRNFENFRLRILLAFNVISFSEDIVRKEKRRKYNELKDTS